MVNDSGALLQALLLPRKRKKTPLRSLANHEAQQEVQESPHGDGCQQLQYTPAGLQPRAQINSTGITTCDLKEKWTEQELKALPEFILFHTPAESWPANNCMLFLYNVYPTVHKQELIIVSCYKGLSDSKVRDLANKIINEMDKCRVMNDMWYFQ